ncbi:SEC-C domain-containing protein [Micromonospora zingiberis]|uniref:SEC-C domain-containing protein n=1 Tax=Micromonospora zingiberis TaxID=2053011 RepID=A0A4R0GJE5_9ACTN|nr:SEC-C domain-containing protein [Micromonospora zingiberis]TCB96433.1 SEC-C domain-containing protein [Micromonospora zingiberis]
MHTILDVIENYAWRSRQIDFQKMSGKELMEFGEEVRRLASSTGPPSERPAEYGATYLGGWVSANPFTIWSSDLILTSLLYSNRVVVRDPVSDWFGFDQYYLERPMSSRPGFLSETGEPNIAETRAFLSNITPQLMKLAPLAKAGLIEILPTYAIHRSASPEIESVTRSMMEQIGSPFEVTRRFDPEDLAHADNVRGLFIFAGGEREKQLLEAIGRAARYFAREFVTAAHTGATYCAPFSFEQYLCGQAGAALRRAEARVSELLISSNVPIFHGLTPDVVADIHDDDTFGEFRRQLYGIYGELPGESEDARNLYLQDRENAVLQPILAAARNEANRGLLSRIGVTYGGHAFGLAAGVATEIAFPTGGVAGVSTAALIEIVKDKILPKGGGAAPTVWTTLTKHHRKAGQELRATPQEAQGINDQGGSEFWGIPAQPSMDIVVTQGSIFTDFVPPARRSDLTSSEYQDGVYRFCECGSGLKYKFCCRNIPRYTIQGKI